MKIKIIILLLLLSASNNFCMKRQLHQISNPIKKKSKTSQSLCNFFINERKQHKKNSSLNDKSNNESNIKNNKLNNTSKKKIKNNPPQDMKVKIAKKIERDVNNKFPKLPQDIKHIVLTNTFKIPQEWWYCEKKWVYQNIIYALSFNPKNDNHLAIGFLNGILKIINPKTNEYIKSDIDFDKNIYALTYNNDGSSLACGLDDELKIMSVENSEYVYTYPLKGTHWSLSFNYDNTQLAVGIENNPENHMKAAIKVIDINNEKESFSKQISERVYGVYMHSNNTVTYALANQKVATINTISQIIENIIKKENIIQNYSKDSHESLFALAYNKNNNTFALGFNYEKNKVLIINSITKQKISSFNNIAPVYALSFTEDGQRLAVGLRNGTLLLLKKHNQPTEKQHLLRRILYLWLQVEKPNKSITDPTQLLDTISTKFHLNKNELNTTWATFPEALQVDIWHNMNRLIQQYGKDC